MSKKIRARAKQLLSDCEYSKIDYFKSVIVPRKELEYPFFQVASIM